MDLGQGQGEHKWLGPLTGAAGVIGRGEGGVKRQGWCGPVPSKEGGRIGGMDGGSENM